MMALEQDVLDAIAKTVTAAVKPIEDRLAAVEHPISSAAQYSVAELKTAGTDVEDLAGKVKAKIVADEKAMLAAVRTKAVLWFSHGSVGAIVYGAVHHFLLPWLP